MHIVTDAEMGILIFLPTFVDEIETITLILDELKPGDQIRFIGIVSRQPQVISFRINKKLFTISPTNDQDSLTNELISQISKYTKGLVFVGSFENIDIPCLVTTGAFCTMCNNTMISSTECRSKVCRSCTNNCEHVFVRHIRPKAGTEYCAYCHRSKYGIESKMDIFPKDNLCKKLKIIGSYIREGEKLTKKQLIYLDKLVLQFLQETYHLYRIH